MMRRRAGLFSAGALALAFALCPTAALAQASALFGGPKGIVKTDRGAVLEGMMVQLISKKSAIRTTVYSDEKGEYEFPKMEEGAYTLRIARPLEFHPFVKEDVAVKGATAFAPIVLRRVTTGNTLPPYPFILAQVSGADWLQVLPGDETVKRNFRTQCNYCHSYQQVFRNRYDEESWAKIVFRMLHGGGSPLIEVRERGRLKPDEEAAMVKWLSTVRGPNSPDPHFPIPPRPKGRATKAVITEYEMPRLELALHDAAGDPKGGIWYSPHRSSYIGRLDPKTGKVEEVHVPLSVKGALPGTHWLEVDPKGIVWGTQVWAHAGYRYDPIKRGFQFIQWGATENEPYNVPQGANLSRDPEDHLWRTRYNQVQRMDPITGKNVKVWPLKKFASTYGSAMSPDGRYFGGGAWPRDGMVIVDTKTDEVFEPETTPFSGPARGEWDNFGTYWSGGRGGVLVSFDTKTKSVREYPLPTQHATLYTARADKHGDVWSGELQAGAYLRLIPKTAEWIEYRLPEPYSHDRQNWIDNTTDPVSVWYVEHDGWVVRIQPREITTP
jgi:virginiamycin B lyase